MTSATNQPALSSPMSRAEQETQNEAERLTGQVEEALAILASHPSDEADSLEASADRIERAARDFVHTLRELAQERKALSDER